MAVVGPSAPLIGGTLAAALIAFVVGRAGDYVDWEYVGPVKLPTWLDVVKGPMHAVEDLR